ncbi:MAG: alpha/beta fold hydrolase, partial [Vicinamibacteria bacterium]
MDAPIIPHVRSHRRGKIVPDMIEENIHEDSGPTLRPFSSRFSAADMDVEAATQFVRTGGWGPAVLLRHGFGDTGDMWQPLAERLVNDHRVIVPD